MNSVNKKDLEILLGKLSMITTFNSSVLGLLVARVLSHQEIIDLRIDSEQQMKRDYPNQNLKEFFNPLFSAIIKYKEDITKKESKK